MSSNSQCRHEEDMCANKRPKNDGCTFNDSRDIQQTSTLGLPDPGRVPVLQTEREFRRVNASTFSILHGSHIFLNIDKINFQQTI